MNAEEAREWLDYSPIEGSFVWRRSPNRRKPVGTKAGSKTCFGYLSICIQGKTYMAHRLAFLLVEGHWPQFEIDHKDGNGMNNRWGNLREVSRAVNRENQHVPGRNNRSGVLGVYVQPRSLRNPFFSKIVVRGKIIHLGNFKTQEAAQATYIEAKRKYHEGNTL